MIDQKGLYAKIAGVSAHVHGSWYLRAHEGYQFARHTHCVPLMAVEFPRALAEYPIVFTESQGQVMPVVLLALSSGHNIHVDEQGHWRARYVPAYVRRYPFIFCTRTHGGGFALALDEEFVGFNTERDGERLFDESGLPAPFLDQVLGFMKEYERQHRLTQAFCEALQRFDLLEPIEGHLALPNGQELGLSDFKQARRERLKALSGEQLQTLMRQNVLELVHAHLLSLEQLQALAEKASDSCP